MSIKISISLLIISLTLSVVIGQSSTNDCIFTSGGYGYNFAKLSTFGGYKYSGLNLAGSSNDTFYVNLCSTAWSCTAIGGPSGMTSCRRNSPFGYIGTVSNGTFESLPSDLSSTGQGAYLTYHSTTGNTLYLTLLCDPNKTKATVIAGGETSSNNFEFTISGAGACGELL